MIEFDSKIRASFNLRDFRVVKGQDLSFGTILIFSPSMTGISENFEDLQTTWYNR